MRPSGRGRPGLVNATSAAVRGLDVDDIRTDLPERFHHRILTLDSHTGGEATRLIVRGLGRIPGQTMEDKRRYFMGNFDHIRLQLTREPRGDRDLLAALLTEATSDKGDFGLVFMDARRYPYLCGHATIGAVTTLIETGNIPAEGPERVVIVDTPSGPVKTTAHIHEDRVTSVATTAVPS
ncbi:MAG: hypothetical protein EOM25_15330, partial [Deltaproteobacteria bacterium]|nr:hypothetical protein [Deltaproteobacteria bacterium]